MTGKPADDPTAHSAVRGPSHPLCARTRRSLRPLTILPLCPARKRILTTFPLSLPQKRSAKQNRRHNLRKSSTFTALDFAPSPRFKHADLGSDASSIRSGRSGMNPVQLNSLRAGAYRVSRIPKEVVGTKNDLMSELRPKWDMRDGATSIKL